MIPARFYQQTAVRYPVQVPMGLDGWVDRTVGSMRRFMFSRKGLLRQAGEILDMADRFRNLSDLDMQSRLTRAQERFRRFNRNHEMHVPEALALLVEAADRTLGLRPFTVQIMGALVLFRGNLIEMQTGEGKTLTAALAAVLSGWSERPCHVITVNDYLADRDAGQLRPFYETSGLTVGCISGTMGRAERRRNYACSVVYTTNKELLADFLKDRLALRGVHDPSRRYLRRGFDERGEDELVLRGLHTAIVDEADSVLVDEAVTPLIISRKSENEPLVRACRTAVDLADRLEKGVHYTVDPKYRDIRLTAAGTCEMESITVHLPPVWHAPSRREELILQTLTAREFFHKGKQYVLQDGKIMIVDEFTGRLMPGRSLRRGLHQILEAAEGVDITHPNEILARLSFQRFFLFFDKLSGMTGTAREVAAELWHIYRLNCVVIPPNRPCIRRTLRWRVFPCEETKLDAILGEIVEVHRIGRPVLVGTRNVRASEDLAARLETRGFAFDLLNAVKHREEAAIIARAGERGRITIATNMAGRGTDIKLGPGVAEFGGLHVIAAERNEAGRIDRQLFGRCARQGDPGTVRPYISLEDELIRRFVPDPVRRKLAAAVSLKLPGAGILVRGVLRAAQRVAQDLAFRQRLSVLRMDDWIEESLSFTGSGPKF